MKLVFCGVGALGSNAVVACRNLSAELVLVDMDRVESKNCLAQAFTKMAVGRNKAEALKLQLSNFWGVRAAAHGVRVAPENVAALCHGAGLVVDAFDNPNGRMVLSDHARRTGTPLVHAGIAGDGSFALVRWDERFVPDEGHGGATCEGGEHLPLITLAAAALARTIQDFLAHGVRRDAMVRLDGATAT